MRSAASDLRPGNINTITGLAALPDGDLLVATGDRFLSVVEAAAEVIAATATSFGFEVAIELAEKIDIPKSCQAQSKRKT